MATTSARWAEAMLPIIREIYTLSGGKEKDFIAEICGRETSKLQSERTMGIGGRTYMKEWNEVGRTAAGAYQDTEKGHYNTFTHKKYVDAAAIERDWIDDQQYEKIHREIRGLRKNGTNTQQHHFASMFNNAWSGAAAHLLTDGFPLAYTAHTYNADGTGGTFSNSNTSLALSAPNLETIRTTIQTTWKDDKGNLLNLDPDDFLLLVPSALRETALVIANSDGKPNTTDNNINVWKGSIDVIEWPRLTDATAYFVIVKPQARDLCHWYDRRALDISDHVDFNSEQALYKIVGRWSFGSDCPPAWVYCAKG